MSTDNSPILILGAAPKEKIKVPDDFYSNESIFFKTLQNPPRLRHYGWNLATLDTPRLKDGEYWELKNGDRKVLRLYSDGSFVVSGLISENFLAWKGGNENEDNEIKNLHALAVIEFTCEFIELYRIIVQNITKSGTKINELNFKIGIRDLNKDNKIGLKPYKINTFGFMLNGPWEKYIIEKDFFKNTEESLIDGTYDPKYVAYDVIVLLFRQFGVTSDIPYTKSDESGKKFVDIEEIKNVQ